MVDEYDAEAEKIDAAIKKADFGAFSKDSQNFLAFVEKKVNHRAVMTVAEFEKFKPLFQMKTIEQTPDDLDRKARYDKLMKEYLRRVDLYSPLDIVDRIGGNVLLTFPPALNSVASPETSETTVRRAGIMRRDYAENLGHIRASGENALKQNLADAQTTEQNLSQIGKAHADFWKYARTVANYIDPSSTSAKVVSTDESFVDDGEWE